MTGDKQFDEKVEDLTNTYEEMVDSYGLEEIACHYRSWISVFRKEQKHTPYRALAEEKIVALEHAIEDFEAVYAAERAEAEKMPLSWAEAERLRAVFDKIFYDKFSATPEERKEQ